MAEAPPLIALPPSLIKHQSPAGSHHLGVKALFYGPPKSGKSFALASYPHPIFGLACGENGIEPYLQPDLGDISITVHEPATYLEALDFALKHPKVASIVVDNINLAFEDWMNAWQDKLKVEQLEGQHWRKVKSPWKTIHRRIMNSPKHFGCSAWPRGAKYTEEEVESKMPGADTIKKLKILEQDAPHTEKMIPFAVDLIFKTEIELDKRFAPTSFHRITYFGGRRPITIPANELHAGKFWRFDASKVGEISPFDKVLKPIMEKWGDGAVAYDGLSPQEADRELGEAEVMANNELVGACLASFKEATNTAALRTAWNAKQADILKLPKSDRDTVEAAKEARKVALGGK